MSEVDLPPMASSLTSPHFSPIKYRKLPLRSPRLLKQLNNLRLPLASSSKSFWSAAESDVEIHLLASLLPTSSPRAVTSPMRRVLSASPRTIFPSLSLAACDLAGGDRSLAVAAASAVAMFQAALHAHLRGTGLTNHELLAGDSLLPLAFEILTASGCAAADPNRVLRAVVEMSAVVRAYFVEEGREGRIGEAAAACGAILGGGGEGEVERIKRFGYNTGVMHGLVRRGRREAAEEFKIRAEREVEEGGFEVGKVEMAKELVKMWWYEEF